MKPIGLIALSVFRESVRDKVLYNLVAFAVILMGASFLIGQLTAGQDLKIIKDLGLTAVTVFGLLIAVFIGIGLVSKEVERRSIYSLLAKPVTRIDVVLGKYAGLLLTLAVNLSMMTIALYLVLAWVGWTVGESGRLAADAPPLDPALLKAVLLVFVQLAIVTAVALFFSTFSTPILSATFTFGIWVAGTFSADLKNFDQVVDAAGPRLLARGLYYALPNFGSLDITAQVVHGLHVPASYLAVTSAYAAVYIAMLLVISATVFSRRDFR